ncbi:MAG: hypothetical protein ABI472_15230 [Ginsengibacter sp.]
MKKHQVIILSFVISKGKQLIIYPVCKKTKPVIEIRSLAADLSGSILSLSLNQA